MSFVFAMTGERLKLRPVVDNAAAVIDADLDLKDVLLRARELWQLKGEFVSMRIGR